MGNQQITFMDLIFFSYFQCIWNCVHSHWCCYWSGGEWLGFSKRLPSDPEEIRSPELLIKLNKTWILCTVVSGCHQTDQPSEAAQEGADHQWDSGDEGAEEPQHRQLFRQVTQGQPAHPRLKGTSVSLCVFVCVSVSWWGRSCLWSWSTWPAGRWQM